MRGGAPRGASVSRPERRQEAGVAGAGLVALGRLRRRGDFLRVQAGRSIETRSFVLKARPRPGQREEIPEEARFGFTVTKRLGKATVRNRARRRLKEAVRLVAARHARAGFDYVLIGRSGALRTAFANLLEELRHALQRIHDGAGARRATN